MAFLEADVEFLTDVYELAIASYVLTLAGSPKAPEVMAKLESLAVVQGVYIYFLPICFLLGVFSIFTVWFLYPHTLNSGRIYQ